MRTAVFLQARMSSQRLPGKALMQLAGKTILQHAIESLHRVPADTYAVLCDKESADDFLPICDACGFELFVGDPENVLARFCAAAHFFETDIIVRATGDNPLVSAEVARKSIEVLHQKSADYAGLLYPPYGTAVEVVRSSCLHTALEKSTDPYDREHVTPYIYNNPDQFSLALEPAPAEWQLNERLTIDTQEDYEYVKTLYTALYSGQPLNIEDVITWCEKNSSKKAKVI